MRSSLAVMGLSLLVAAGCGSKLETGYQPRKLGSTETERRGFYAAPYTAEARAAEVDRAPVPGDVGQVRPGY